MFTGLVEGVGEICAVRNHGADVTFEIKTPWSRADLALGDSVAISGVCLTVSNGDGTRFTALLSGETLACTALGGMRVSSKVNLERAVTPTTRLGGHMVSGHVDGVATLKKVWDDGSSRRMVFQVPVQLAHYIATKGSICVDGVSLTVNSVAGELFEVNIIPHTLSHTTLGALQSGQSVNIEVDLVARYIERLMQARADSTSTSTKLPNGGALSREFLNQSSFIRGDGSPTT